VVNPVVWSNQKAGFGWKHSEMNGDQEFPRNLSVRIGKKREWQTANFLLEFGMRFACSFPNSDYFASCGDKQIVLFFER
jgi:hypothetical protein